MYNTLHYNAIYYLEFFIDSDFSLKNLGENCHAIKFYRGRLRFVTLLKVSMKATF